MSLSATVETELSHHHALIGAGPVGLCVARHLKDAKIPYTQFEADDDVGGNWYHGVYNSAHIISSRKTTEYADWPMPEDYPDFPSRQQLLDYFRAYADGHGLRSHLQFQTKVTWVAPHPSGEGWAVTMCTADAAPVTRRFKGVIVCNGHHWDKRMPTFEGSFDGEILHSKDFKSPDRLRGKRVLVMGGGNSACDIVSEAARVADHASLSLRRGYWFLPKTFLGRPTVELIRPWMPVAAQRVLLKALLRITIGKYSDYGLPTPDHKIYERHPTISTEVLHYIKHGRIKPRKDVKRLDGERVTFVDDTSAAFDTIVCATGYHVSYPFLAPGIVDVKGPVTQAVGGCTIPGQRSLYVVGSGQPRYGLGPLISPFAELLCTYIELQEELEHDLGTLFEEMGDKPPQTHLIDPHAALRQLRLGKKFAPKLLRRTDKKLRAKTPKTAPPAKTSTAATQSPPPAANTSAKLHVY